MSFKGFLKKTGPLVIKTPDALSDALVQVQEATQEVFNELKGIPFLDGVWLRSIALTTTSQGIAHKLGRKYLGFIVTNRNANATVFVNGTDQNETFIRLQASANVVVDLWVF